MTQHNLTDRNTEQPKRAVVVSYVPRLADESGRVMATDDSQFHDKLSKIAAAHDGHVDACLWMAEENGVFPVFVMKDAHAVADHLVAWAEGRPGDWFALCFAEGHGRYVAGLFPNVSASVDRFEGAHLISHGRASNADGHDIIFRPLTFVSGPKHMFGRVKGLIPASATVGFVERSEDDPQVPASLSPTAIRRVGPFPVCWDAKLFGFDIQELHPAG